MLSKFRTRLSRKFDSTSVDTKVLLGVVVVFFNLSKVLVFVQQQYSYVYTTALEHLQKLY